MVVFRGSHGTCRSNAELIKKRSVDVSRGRIGTGIYAWTEFELYLELAKGWYRQSLNRHSYKTCNENSGVILVLSCEIGDRREYIDLTDSDYQSMLYKVAKQLELDVYNENDVGAAADFLISKLEEKQGIRIAVVEFLVDYPNEKFMDIDRWPKLIWPKVRTYSYRFAERVNVEEEIPIGEKTV